MFAFEIRNDVKCMEDEIEKVTNTPKTYYRRFSKFFFSFFFLCWAQFSKENVHSQEKQKIHVLRWRFVFFSVFPRNFSIWHQIHGFEPNLNTCVIAFSNFFSFTFFLFFFFVVIFDVGTLEIQFDWFHHKIRNSFILFNTKKKLFFF